MKRNPLLHPRVIDNDMAIRYVKSHANINKRTGGEIAKRLKRMGVNEGMFLDAGCGPGHMTLELALALPYAQIVGVDLSQPCIEMGNKLADEYGIANRLKFQMGDIQNLPFKNDMFDFVCSVHTIHIVEEPVKMLNEINRVLKPNGNFAILDIRRSYLGLLISIFKTAYNEDEVKQIIAESNISEYKIEKNIFLLTITN